MSELSRRRYGGMFGPTAGDRLRLADTALVVQVERNLTLAGEEATFGGGKSVREGMAQGAATRTEGAMDLVITNALILNRWRTSCTISSLANRMPSPPPARLPPASAPPVSWQTTPTPSTGP